jgi:hypothetical protein
VTAHWTDALRKLHACDEAVAWCQTQPDLATAWATCERGDWMLWLIGRTGMAGEIGSPERRVLVGVASGCARLALPIFEQRRPGDARVRDLLGLLDRYAAGDETVTLDAIQTARRNAAAAAYAAYAAVYAGDAAVYAGDAADAAYAADAAVDAADAAAAAAAYAAYAAYAAARAKVRRETAAIVRAAYPVAPVLAESLS